MFQTLTNHLWQSTFFALAAGLLTLAFRKNRASVRYWLWLSASLKFFIPFALLLNLGRYLETLVPAARQIATPAVSYTIEQFSGPFFPDNLPAPAPARDTIHWMPIATLAIWLSGFAAVALVRFRNWLRVRATVRASTAANISATVEVRASPGLLEPGVVGLVRPILLLPEGIAERLTPSELNAVLAHEFCHIGRRDNLFAAIHMMVEAIFWFHPLVWWIGARLVDERERACDEEVLSRGNQPEVYADAILNICKFYIESPLACVSGVSGAGIRRRVEAIMSNRKLQGLNRGKKLLLTAAGIAALAGPIAIGLLIGVGNIPVIHAQPPVPPPPARIQLAQAPPPTAPDQNAPSQSPVAAKPKFEVASIRRCSAPDRRRPGGGGGQSSTDRLTVECKTVMDLIRTAYGPHAWLSYISIERGPGWINSDGYSIEAKAEGTPGEAMMSGPMLQALLEDRFQLKIRRETREIPVYALTEAKGGVKLQPSKEGSCVPRDLTLQPPYPQFCGDPRRGDSGFRLIGATMEDLCATLSVPEMLGRKVIDRTGITGMFDIPIPGPGDFHARAIEAGSPDDAFEIAKSAIKELGLNIESTKGPGEFLVIDHVERPSEN